MGLWPSKYNYNYRLDDRYTLINNFLTGALDLIENVMWDCLPIAGKSRRDCSPLSDLIERGYFYEDPQQEERLFRDLFDNFKRKADARPIKYVICPTYSCNLRCTYCFEKNLAGNPCGDMDDEMLEQVFHSIRAVSKQSGKEINTIELFGGEPILPRNRGMVNKILEFASQNGASITIITNGVFAGDFTEILEPVRGLIEMVQITVDGPREIHDSRRKSPSGKGSFEDISSSISKLLDAGINTNARVNLDASNIGYLPGLYDYMNKKGWTGYPNFRSRPSLVTDHTTLEHIYPIIAEDVLLEKLINIYDDNPELEEAFGFYSFKPIRHIIDILNGAPNVSPRYYNCESNLLEMFIFCPDGFIYTCPESIGSGSMSIGRFFPDLELREKDMDRWRDRDIMNMEKCSSCRFAPICGGGCPLASLEVSNGREPVCERFQEVLDTFLKYRGKMILERFAGNTG